MVRLFCLSAMTGSAAGEVKFREAQWRRMNSPPPPGYDDHDGGPGQGPYSGRPTPGMKSVKRLLQQHSGLSSLHPGSDINVFPWRLHQSHAGGNTGAAPGSGCMIASNSAVSATRVLLEWVILPVADVGPTARSRCDDPCANPLSASARWIVAKARIELAGLATRLARVVPRRP